MSGRVRYVVNCSLDGYIEDAHGAGAVRELKAAATSDLAVGNAVLAGQALRAGVVDEVEPVVAPVVLGGGKPALPDGVRLDLALTGVRRFEATGVVSLRYRVEGTT